MCITHVAIIQLTKLAKLCSGGSITIFANCNSNNAAKGERSIPPISGINFRQAFNNGSVRLVKIEEVASKPSGRIQLNKALANIA